MAKCDIETMTACIERLLRAWPKPVGIKDRDWSMEMADLFQNYSPEAVRIATDEAVDKFKKLPVRAQMRELLARESESSETHQALLKQNAELNYKLDPANWTDEQIVAGLLWDLYHNQRWPALDAKVERMLSPFYGMPVWTERGKRIRGPVIEQFLSTMDHENTYHLLSFHWLRTMGFIPMDTPMPVNEAPLDTRAAVADRAAFIESVMVKYGFSKKQTGAEEKKKAQASYMEMCQRLGIDPNAIPDARPRP